MYKRNICIYIIVRHRNTGFYGIYKPERPCVVVSEGATIGSACGVLNSVEPGVLMSAVPLLLFVLPSQLLVT